MEAQDVDVKAMLLRLEAKLNNLELKVDNIAQRDGHLQNSVQQLANDVEEKLNEKIIDVTTRFDEKLEKHVKEVNELHFRDCENQ